MDDLGGTRVLVTGAAVRIGRQIALSFARRGARVVIHYNRSEEQAEALLSELGGRGAGHDCIRADLLDPSQRQELIPSLVRHGQTITCLVNNASVYRRCPLAKVDADRLRQDYEINFVVPFLLMRDFACYCEEGNIINLLDRRVATVDPSASSYGLAKKSLRDATEAAAVQWAPHIRVNGVAPGLVLPPQAARPERMERLLRAVPMRQASSAEEVAEACLFLATTRTVTGQIIYVDGGMHLVGETIPEMDEVDYSPPTLTN